MSLNETWQQKAARQRRIKRVRQGGKNAPMLGVMRQINPLTELATVEHPGDENEMQVRHPFASMTSWIRSMPDEGMGTMIYYRADTSDLAILDYYNPTASTRLDTYRNQLGPYRILQPGEHEIHSSGFAQTYYGRRAVKEDRAGVVKAWMDQDELDEGAKSPVHTRRMIGSPSAYMTAIERLGVVKRPADSDTSGKSSIYSKYPKYKGGYATEYFLDLQALPKDRGITESRLVRKQEGEVLDDEGAVIKSAETGKDLRMLHKYYNTAGGFLKIEIDDEGNHVMSLPTQAKEGIIVNVPGGSVRYEIGKASITNIGTIKRELVNKDSTTQVGGVFTMQTLAGDSIVMNPKEKTITIKDQTGNEFQTTEDGVTITDKAGNKLTMADAGFNFLSKLNKFAGDLVTNNFVNNDPITGKPLIGIGGMKGS